MNIDRLKQKIRKLLALASAGSGQESASAGRLAHRLMSENGLRPEDLGPAPPHVLLVAGRSWPIWRRTLLTFAAQSNEVAGLFRRSGKVTEAKFEGEMSGCQRAMTFYVDLVRVVNELETMLGERLRPYLLYFQGLGTRKATDSIRRGITYGLITAHTSKASRMADHQTTASPSSNPADFKKPSTEEKKAVPPSVSFATPDDGYLVKIEEGQWEPMGDPGKIFEAASQALFDLGERLARGCVVVDEAGYARVINVKSEVGYGIDD